MAEKTPEKAEPTPQPAGSAKAKSGISAYLPLIVIVVLAPVSALLTMRIISKGAKKSAAPATAPAPPSAGHAPEDRGSHAEAKAVIKEETTKRRQSVTVPLTRDTVGFHPKKHIGKLSVMDVNGDALREAEAETIRVNVPNTRGAQLVVARLAVQGDDPPLVVRFNQNRFQLLEIASEALAGKTLEEVNKSGITNVLSSELRASFNQALGPGTVQSVDFLQFAVRRR